jgi:hypothetical protein
LVQFSVAAFVLVCVLIFADGRFGLHPGGQGSGALATRAALMR